MKLGVSDGGARSNGIAVAMAWILVVDLFHETEEDKDDEASFECLAKHNNEDDDREEILGHGGRWQSCRQLSCGFYPMSDDILIISDNRPSNVACSWLHLSDNFRISDDKSPLYQITVHLMWQVPGCAYLIKFYAPQKYPIVYGLPL